MDRSAQPVSAESFEFRHRNPLAGSFVVVSGAILTGYGKLSDGAKVTYCVIYSHDWYEPEREGRKGYVYPSIGRIARLRRKSDRTIQRHLAELLETKLLTREPRPGKPSVLYIEEPAAEESRETGRPQKPRGDQNVTPTKLSPEEDELFRDLKKDKSINAGEENYIEDGKIHPAGGPMHIKDLLRIRSGAVAPTSTQDWLAEEIVTETGDRHSLGCYRVIAKRCPPDIVFESLSVLRDARHNGTVRRSRGALFLAIVRRRCAERGVADPLSGSAIAKLEAHATTINDPNGVVRP